jgi:cell division protein FtsB
MANKFKVIGGLSRKARFNITIVIILLFIIIIVFASINQVKQIIEKRREITELEEKLSWHRNENIELLALEKSLYEQEGIELEARKQFNMVHEGEKNIVIVLDSETNEMGAGAETKQDYSSNDLWGNINVFYKQEIKDK